LKVLIVEDSAPVRERCRQLGAGCFFNKSTGFERVLEVLANLADEPPFQPPAPSPVPHGSACFA